MSYESEHQERIGSFKDPEPYKKKFGSPEVQELKQAIDILHELSIGMPPNMEEIENEDGTKTRVFYKLRIARQNLDRKLDEFLKGSTFGERVAQKRAIQESRESKPLSEKEMQDLKAALDLINGLLQRDDILLDSSRVGGDTLRGARDHLTALLMFQEEDGKFS